MVTKAVVELDCEHGGRSALHEDGEHLMKLGLPPSVDEKDSVSFEGLLLVVELW